MTNIRGVIFCLLVALAISAFAGIFYLNEVVIPVSLRLAAMEEIAGATGKKVMLESLRLNLLKGIVLQDLLLYDDKGVILKAGEVSCALIPINFFKKEMMIPAVRIKNPRMLLVRGADNSINLLKLLNPAYVSKSGYKAIIHRISITDADVDFIDETLTPTYTGKLEKLDIHLYLSLPSKVRFDVEFEIPSAIPIKVDSSGEYEIGKNALSAKIIANDISLKEFMRYYEDSGITIPEGSVDAVIELDMKDGVVNCGVSGKTKGLGLYKDGLSLKLGSDINAVLRYTVADKGLNYEGVLKIEDMAISGVQHGEDAHGIKGEVKFTDSGISSENITAKIFDIPVDIKINTSGPSTGIFDIYMTADINLARFKEILKEKFKIDIHSGLEGEGKLYLTLQYDMPVKGPARVMGSLEVSDATIRPDIEEVLLEKVNGTVQFTGNTLAWSDLELIYRGVGYRVSGELVNFDKPGIQLKLSSKDLYIDSVFAVSGNAFNFAKLSGRYLDSGFSVKGRIYAPPKEAMTADITGEADFAIGDLKTVFKDLKGRLERMKAGGRAKAEFRLKGGLKDIASSAMEAKIFSNSITLYGLKPTDVVIDYRQAGGTAEMTRIHSFLYGGTLDAYAKLDLSSPDGSYYITADMRDVRLERLKQDTGFKEKDLAGSIRLKAKISGRYDDDSSITGSGSLSVTNGKLWQLNLFRGLGVLIFTSDFNDVIFRDMTASFVIKEKAFSTDGMWLKSDLIDIYGSATIGFDKSVNASLKAELTEEALRSGAKDITKAIGRYTSIDIRGTLKDPKYRVKPDIGGILGDIQDAVFQQ